MIVVRDIYKRFKLSSAQRRKSGGPRRAGSIDAVAGISFTCQPGRVFSLLGPNGAGKTTTLRMISTMFRQDKGDISVAGHDTLAQPNAVRAQLGFLTGATGLYDRLTPLELVKYFADLHRIDKATFLRRRDELFERLDMGGFASRRIGKLSTGMKQKVSIARTLIHDPQVVVFDEPTAGLDVITAKNIIQLIRDLKARNKTIIFSTHIMGEVSLLSDDLAIIHQGKLCFNDSYDAFVAQMKTDSLIDEFIRIVEEA